jgi:hypothetical protein
MDFGPLDNHTKATSVFFDTAKTMLLPNTLFNNVNRHILETNYTLSLVL